MTETLFISDLHLDPSRPQATAAFLRFLKGEARDADQLFILGDLFEFWIGDDDDDPHSGEVLAGLREYTALQRKCLVMRGNRDFLLGAGFEQRTGATLLGDTLMQSMYGEPVLVMHGDLLCTDDRGYQRFRRVVNQPLVQRLFLALPRGLRRAMGAEGRRRSRAYTATGPPQIMDVNDAAVADAMRRAGVRTLVHGHTHRPAIHRIELDGHPATRIVLGDWYDQGSVLRWSPAGFELATVRFA